MQANWQFPHSLESLTLPTVLPSEPVAVAPRPAAGRDRFDYWLIFAICLPIFVWVGILARFNPLYWRAPRKVRKSLWSVSKREAHHCATLALQG